MTPALDLPVAPPTAPAPTAAPAADTTAFRQKETVLAGYLAAFAVVYYRLPAERAPAQLTATLHIETADTAFPPAAVTLQLADDRPLAEVAAEAAARLLMALAGVPDELGAAIGRGRLAFAAPEAQTPDHTWELTVSFGSAPGEAATLSFGTPGEVAAPRETAYLPAHVQAVFAQLTHNPAALVGHVFFLAEEEVAQLRQFRAGPALVAEGRPQQLHQLFEETARAYPSNVALSWLGQPCTYHELDARADQLAAYLRQQGVQAGDFVGLLMAKSVELYVGMLAVLKAGAAYVPLDLSFPPDRVSFILADCGARALLINNDLPEGLAAWPGQVLDLRPPVPAAPPLAGPAAGGPDSTAYVIYTSGTTGLPKGVLIPHRSICHLVRAEQQLFQPPPPDRVSFILDDCGARALLINNDLPEGLAAWPGQVLDLRPSVPAATPLAGPAAVGPDSTAYVIYTSGTTGLPKGVLIPHRSICHLVRAEQQLFQPTPHDRVVQGFSVAFDASLEELWLAWAAGAALVPVPEEIMKAPDALPGFLTDNHVTIFSTVPTLLSLLPAAVPTLRLLVLGGEVCPPELLAKWASRQCRVVNTYGPTEATVVATAADFVPGHKLTIGRPLAGYEVLILDQQGQLLPPGAAGELCIGGAALAAGYLNRPELSAAKFNTVSELANGFGGRLYRTGDLARFEADGNIDFLGRIDTQVKIRGFRVELAEIESLLLQWPGIRNAAVALKEGTDGVKKLIAYLILEPNQLLDEKAVRAYLRERLAPYMLPAALVPLAAFPLLTSGKVDRKALPYPVGGGQPVARELTLPRTPTEAAIYSVWQKRFDTADLSITDDFFDLGGNSLLASLIVSELRQSPEFQGLSVKEMYTRRTIAALAAAVEAETQRAQAAPAAPELASAPLWPASVGTRLATAVLQAGAVFLFYAGPILLLNGSLHWRGLLGGWSWEVLVALVLGATLAYVPLACGLTVALKWLVIGRFRAGEYPLWGWYYLRFWLVKKLVEGAPTQLLSATPFLAVFYRLLGAKIGQNVYLGTTRVMAFDLLTIHDGASLAREAGLLGYRVERDRLIIGPITVGHDAYVGLRAILENDTQVGDEAELDDLSVLPAGQQIPAREGWLGSPARRGRAVASGPLAARPAPGAGYQVAQLLAIALMLLVPTLAAAPVLGLFYEAVERWDFEPALLTLLPLSALYVVVLGGLLASIKRFAAGRQAAGTLPLHSLAYVRHWLADAVLAQSLALMKSLYATIYAPYWLRLLGANIGRRAEVSTLNHISADHLTVGAGAFLADSVSVGAPRVQHGLVQVQPTVVGERTFIGNSAVLAGGTVLGAGNLIGALSSAPPDTPADGTSWVGSPAFLLPNRPVSAAFAAELTFAPPARLVWARGAVEIFKIILPYTFAFLTFAILYHYTKWHLLNYPFWSSVGVGTGAFVAIIMGFSLLTALLKWVLIGRYRPSEKPLWSSFVWRNEFINSLCESYVYPFWEAPLLGTPFATWFFQLMGSHFGHSVYLDTTEITEFDLAWVADHAVLNNGATIQTHLFEDRIMKMSDLRIGRAATVGTSSVVLYDSVIGPGATLKSLSLLMKGEKLPAETRWQGIPSSFVSG